MYRTPTYTKTMMEVPSIKEGETIEQKVTRLIQNKEPIKDGAPTIFTERAHGVNPAHNIRTDRWEIAIDALNRIEKVKTAQRDAIGKQKDGGDTEGKVIQGSFGKPESTDGKQSVQS